jgi:hypothetical protein
LCFIGTGDYSNEPNVISKEPSFGLKFGFLKNGKVKAYSAEKSTDVQMIRMKMTGHHLFELANRICTADGRMITGTALLAQVVAD